MKHSHDSTPDDWSWLDMSWGSWTRVLLRRSSSYMLLRSTIRARNEYTVTYSGSDYLHILHSVNNAHLGILRMFRGYFIRIFIIPQER